jgi:5-methylcytosine-specific restriction enzyme subunit McrC
MLRPPTQRTLILTERVPSECHLAPADVAFLLAEHSNRFQLLPTDRRDRYRLRPLGVVGVLVAPTCRLVIRPKIPLRSLFHLIDPAASLPATDDRTTPAPAESVLDFLAGQLAHRLTERAAAGLHRAYAERSEQAAFLHGRLDVTAQLREPPGRKERLNCRYEDFTADVPCNQLPKATAEGLLRSPLLGDGVRAELTRALQGFGGVASVPLDRATFDSATPPGARDAYRPLLDLCRLLAEGLGPTDAVGQTPCPAFLLDVERIFERYVTRGVEEAFAGRDRYVVAVQPLLVANRSVPGQPDVEMRPDVITYWEGKPALVVDAKWKRPPRTSLIPADLYQMLAYCAALGVPRAVLVYPGRIDRTWTYRLTHGSVEVLVQTLRVAAGAEACRRSLHRFGVRLRKSIRT